MTEAPDRSTGRLVSVDALRGLAAVAVMLFHYTTRYDELFIHREAISFSVAWGYLGVNLFFMISGFVIFMTLDRTRRPSDFVVSRFSRLFPAYWIAVALTYVIVSAVGLPGKSVSTFEFGLNFLMFHSLFGVPSVDGVYWTLEVELLFYLMMLLLWTSGALRRPRLVIAAWLAVSSARVWLPALLGVEIPYVVTQFLILRHIPYFAAGMTTYLMFKLGLSRDPRDWALLAAVVGTIGVSESPEHVVWAMCFIALLVVAVFARPRALTLWPLVWLGAISYPLYLIHENVGWALMLVGQQAGIPPIVSVFGVIAIALGLAAFIHYAVEMPAMRRIRDWYRRRLEQGSHGETFDKRRWLAGLLAVLLAVLAVNRIAVARMRSVAKVDYSPPPIAAPRTPAQPCVSPELGRPVVLLVLGQSNAANHGLAGSEATNASVFFDSKCYKLSNPVAGGTGSLGSPWPRLAELLEQKGRRNVVFAVHAIDATSVSQWGVDGWVSGQLEEKVRQLQRADLSPSVVLWQQGEADARKGTSAEKYIDDFSKLVQRLRKAGVQAPILIARSSECRGRNFGTINRVQFKIPALMSGVFRGPDLDSIGVYARYDGCHFGPEGIEQVAQLWANALDPVLARQ